MTDDIKSRPGRPSGSGAQLPAIARTRASRAKRSEAGHVRLDVSLDQSTYAALSALMQHWGCTTKKETIEKAILAAATTIFKE